MKFILNSLFAVGFHSVTFAQNPFNEIGRTYYAVDAIGRRMDSFTKTEAGGSTASVDACYNYCIGSTLTIRSFGLDSRFSPPSCKCSVDNNALSQLPSNYASSTHSSGHGIGPWQFPSSLFVPATTEDVVYYQLEDAVTVPPYEQVGTGDRCVDASGNSYTRKGWDAGDSDQEGITTLENCAAICAVVDSESPSDVLGFEYFEPSKSCVCQGDGSLDIPSGSYFTGTLDISTAGTGSGPITQAINVSPGTGRHCYKFSASPPASTSAPTTSPTSPTTATPTRSPIVFPYYSIGSGYHPRDINGMTYEYFRTIQTPHINSLDDCSLYCRSNPNGVTIRAFTLNPVDGGINNGVLPGCTCSVDNNQVDNVPQSYSDQRQQHRDGVGIVAGLQLGEWSVDWFVYESTGSFAPTNAPSRAPTHKPTKAPTTKNPTKSPTVQPTGSPTGSSYFIGNGYIGQCQDENDTLFDWVELDTLGTGSGINCHEDNAKLVQLTCDSVSNDHGLTLVGWQYGRELHGAPFYHCIVGPKCLYANVASPPNLAFETRVIRHSFGGGAVGVPVSKTNDYYTYINEAGDTVTLEGNDESYCYADGTRSPTPSPTISPTKEYPKWEHVGAGLCSADSRRDSLSFEYNKIGMNLQNIQDGICAETCVNYFDNLASNIKPEVALRGFSNGNLCFCYYDAANQDTANKPPGFQSGFFGGIGPIGNTLISSTGSTCNRFTEFEETIQQTQLIGKDRNCHDNDNVAFDCVTVNIYAIGGEARCSNWCWENRVTGLMGYMVEPDQCHCLYSDGMIDQFTQLNATEPWVITSTNNGVGIPAFKDLGTSSHLDHRDCYVYSKPFYGDGVQAEVTDLGQGQCTAGGQSYDLVWYDVGVAPEMTPDEQIALCYFTSKPEIRGLFEGVIHQSADQDRIFCLFDNTAEPLDDSKFFRVPDGKFVGNTATGPPDGTNGQLGFDCYAFNTNATAIPTVAPTVAPTGAPTTSPTLSPSTTPTVSPTDHPSTSPTGAPTLSPNNIPTTSPIINPTGSPTVSPSANPTGSPTPKPTTSPIPAIMTRVGIGHCLDVNGNKYDKVFFNRAGKDTLEGCYEICTSWVSAHNISNALRGFNYNPSGTSSCQCNFDDHLEVSSVPRESYDSRQTSNTGTGPIYSSGGSFTGETFECIAIGSGPPTMTPTQSPIRFVDASYLLGSNQTCRDSQGNPYDYVLLDDTGISDCDHLCRNLSDTVTTGLTTLVGYEQSLPAGAFCACLFEDGLVGTPGSAYESHPGYLNSVTDRTGSGMISFGGSLIQGDVDCYTFGTEAPTMAPTAAPTREFPKYKQVGTGECRDEQANLYDTFSFSGTDCSNECYDRELSYGAACVYVGYTHDLVNNICHCHCSENMVASLIAETTIDSRNGTGPVVGTTGEADKTCYQSINPDAAFENFHVGHGECHDYQNNTFDKIVYPMSLMDGWWKCSDYCADYRVNDFLVGYEIAIGKNCSCLYSDRKLEGFTSVDALEIITANTGLGAIISHAHEHHGHDHTGLHNHCYKYTNNFHFTPVDRGAGQCINSVGDMYDRFFYDMDEPVSNINDALEFCMAASPPDILDIFRGTTTFENKPNRIYCLYDNGLGQKLKPDMNPEATGIYRGHFASGPVTGANGAQKLHCYSAELTPTPAPTTAVPTTSPFTPPASTLVSANGKCADVFSRLYVEHPLGSLERSTCARDCHNKASAVGYQYALNNCVCLTADGPNGSGRGKIFGVNGTDGTTCYSFDTPRLPSRAFINVGVGNCLGSDGKSFDKVEFTNIPASYCSDFCCSQYELFDHLVGTEFTLDNKCRCLYKTPGLDEHDLNGGVDIDIDESTTVISTSDGSPGLTCFDKGTASPTGSPTRRPTAAPSPVPTRSPTIIPIATYLGKGFPNDANGNRYELAAFTIINVTVESCYAKCFEYDRTLYPYNPMGMGIWPALNACGCFFDDEQLPGPEEFENVFRYNASWSGKGPIVKLEDVPPGTPPPDIYSFEAGVTPVPTKSPVGPTLQPTTSPTSTAFTFIGIGSGIDGQNQFDSVTYYGTWDESTCYDKCTDYDSTVILNSPVGMLIGTSPTDNGCECLWESPIPDRVLFPGSDEYNTVGLASGKLVFLQRDEVKKFLYTFGEPTSPDAWIYAKQGDGLCLDQHDQYYDRVVYDGVRDENACASTCQNDRVGDNLVAFNYESTVYKRCICYYKDSIPPESEFPSNDAYDNKFKGNTTVGGTLSNGLEYYDCYAYNATNSPTTAPTGAPTVSPTTAPTQSPTTPAPTVSPTQPITFNFVGFGDCRDTESRLYDHSIIDLPDGNHNTCHGHFTSRASAVGFMVRTDTKKCFILYSNPMPAFENLGPNVVGFDSSHDGVGMVSTADGSSLSKRCYTATAPTPAPTISPTESSSDSFIAIVVTYSVVGFMVIVAFSVVFIRNRRVARNAAQYNKLTDF